MGLLAVATFTLGMSACSSNPEQETKEAAYDVIRATGIRGSDSEIDEVLPLVCDALQATKDAGFTWQKSSDLLVQERGWTQDQVTAMFAVAVAYDCPDLKSFIETD